MSRTPKNNNLSKYRQEQQIKNEALVQRAIKHIQMLDGEVSFSQVSNVTYDIADTQNGEKGITVAGISKSKIYRPMIEKEKNYKRSSHNAQITSRSKVSIGDMQMLFHGLRVENAKLKMENRLLSESLKEVKVPEIEMGNIQNNVITQYQDIKQIAVSLVSRLLELELAYIDTELSTLNISVYDEVIVPKEALKVFFTSELHNEL